MNPQRVLPLYARTTPITVIYDLSYFSFLLEQTFLEHLVTCSRHCLLVDISSRPSAFPARLPPDNLLQAASAVVYTTDCPPTTNEKEEIPKAVCAGSSLLPTAPF